MSSEEAFKLFTTLEILSAVSLLLISFVGFLLIAFLFYALFRPTNSHSNSIIFFSFLMNALLLCILFGFTTFYSLIHQGFALPTSVCINILAPLVLALECANFLNITALVMNLYLLLVYRIDISRLWTLVQTIAIWILAIFAGGVGRLINRNKNYSMAPSPSGLVCSTNWSDKHKETIIVVLVILSFILTCIIAVSFVYFSIFRMYFKSNRPNGILMKMNYKERLLFQRSIGICLSFFFFWIPYLFLILYEFSTGERVTSEFDCVAVLSLGMFHLISPTVIIYQDSDVRHQIYQLFSYRLDTPSTFQSTSDASGTAPRTPKPSSSESISGDTLTIQCDQLQIVFSDYQESPSFNPMISL